MPAGLTLAEIGAVVSRPLVGLDEESSELERLCLAARAAVADAAAREAAAGLCDSETSEDDEDAEGSSAEDAWGLENGGGAFLGMQQQLPPVPRALHDADPHRRLVKYIVPPAAVPCHHALSLLVQHPLLLLLFLGCCAALEPVLARAGPRLVQLRLLGLLREVDGALDAVLGHEDD